jgi:hypothetical protein
VDEELPFSAEFDALAGTGAQEPLAKTTPLPAAAAPAARSLVVLWDVAAERQEALRTALALRGVAVRLWTGPPPPPALDQQPVKAVIVGGGGGAEGAAKAAALRAESASARLPLLVIDVPGSGAVAGLIRAGASDAVLQAAGEELICTKVLRLIQRGR